MQGGVGAYTQILARHFAALGNDVFLLTHTQAVEDAPGIKREAISGWGINALPGIRGWVKRNRLDVISLQFETAAYQMSPWVHFVPQVAGAPVVATFHDLLVPYLFPKAGRVRDWIVMHLARTSAGVIATNHEDFARLRHLPCATLIPIGSNIAPVLPATFDREQQRQRAGAVPETFLLAYFGFLNRSKGVETLLHALANLREQKIPVRLVMIGGRTGSSDPSNAAYAAEIDHLISQLNLNESIHWTGYADEREVSAWLAASDLIALPFNDGASYRRGSLMAAIAHGCPILTTTPTISIPTFVHQENLWLTPIGDAQALSEAITHLLETPMLRQRLAEGARKLDQQFQWDAIAHDCLALFQRVSAASC
ncbi:MAG: glycosyltransferase family 4 protein [bacterium]|nr:glycosyltransferase family 4 protein [bacterium]